MTYNTTYMLYSMSCYFILIRIIFKLSSVTCGSNARPKGLRRLRSRIAVGLSAWATGEAGLRRALARGCRCRLMSAWATTGEELNATEAKIVLNCRIHGPFGPDSGIDRAGMLAVLRSFSGELDVATALANFRALLRRPLLVKEGIGHDRFKLPALYALLQYAGLFLPSSSCARITRALSVVHGDAIASSQPGSGHPGQLPGEATATLQPGPGHPSQLPGEATATTSQLSGEATATSQLPGEGCMVARATAAEPAVGADVIRLRYELKKAKQQAAYWRQACVKMRADAAAAQAKGAMVTASGRFLTSFGPN